MEKKYERIPPATKANWMLFSMHGIPGINAYLNHFPGIYEQPKEPDYQHVKACSVSLLWSGTAGNNVPIHTFGPLTTGFVLNPSLIEIPQADLIAYRSGGRVVEEKLKTETDVYGDFGSTRQTSKYPQKAGYTRTGMGQGVFATNLARNEHLPGDKKLAIYHPKGRADVFAKNIWRKYFKTGKYHYPDRENFYRDRENIMRLNEGIAFQKQENQNPIAGLLITDTPSQEISIQLLDIMKQNPSLDLYLYSKHSPEHIVRVLNNNEGRHLLEHTVLFESAFKNARAFSGFHHDPSPPQLVNEAKRGVEQMITLLLGLHDDANPQLQPLLTQLIQHSQNFLDDGLLVVYKTACEHTLESYKKELSYERGDPCTIVQHITEAFRTLFNVFDVWISNIRGKETMAETYNPAARFFMSQNYFLSPPKPTPIAETIQTFTNTLNTLQ